MKKSVDEIKKILIENFKYLKEKYKIKKIGIFGSYIRREENKKSDIDILIELEDDSNITLFDIVRIERFLTELIGIKVDLLTINGLSPYIKPYILKEVEFIEEGTKIIS